MNKKEKKKAIISEEITSRKIVNEWNPIGVPVPEDEYDYLVQRLVSKLHFGCSEDDLAILIENELKDYFGIIREKSKIRETAQKIFKFWMSRT